MLTMHRTEHRRNHQARQHSLHRHRTELHHSRYCSRTALTGMPSSSLILARRSAITTNATPTTRALRHAITLEVDEYGNVLKSVAIGYGRRVSPLAEEADGRSKRKR